MSKVENISGIADDTKPNMGRIYDYFLGGSHNFEIDRIFAAKILAQIPLAPKQARLVRWFLGEAVHRLLNDGITQFIDFASGLPVQDHIHQIAPAGTKVIYSDIDPITVAYAAEILGDAPDVLYLRCDIANPLQILDTSTVSNFFDRKRKTAIGMNGITYFMDDDTLSHSLDVLYNWAKEGDKLYLCDTDNAPTKEGDAEIGEMYANMGNSVYTHSIERMSQLLGHWKPVPPGFSLLEEWVNIAGTPLSFSAEERERHDGNFYGVILEK